MTESSAELAPRLTEEALIARAKAGMVDAAEMTIPILKIAQSLTDEVEAGDAEAGELLNSLTGESYGTSAQLVIVDSFVGRAWKNRKTGAFRSVGAGAVVVPWDDHPCHGQHFVDCEDAEEQFRSAVRANEKDWGNGPGISTTYNFVGLIVTEDGLETFPVRVSLLRSSAKEGRNWQTMLQIARAPWDMVYELSTSQTRSSRGEPYIAVKVKQARKATAEEKQAALEVAALLHGGETAVSYDEAPEDGTNATPVAPADTGGLGV